MYKLIYVPFPFRGYCLGGVFNICYFIPSDNIGVIYGDGWRQVKKVVNNQNITGMRKYDIEDYLVNGRYSLERSERIKEQRKEEAVQAYRNGKAKPIQKGMVRWADGTKSSRHGTLKNTALRATNNLLTQIFTFDSTQKG